MDAKIIQDLRAAGRQLVREFRALDGRGCVPGLSFSECHFLTELDQRGLATASDLGAAMVLEKSTISRMAQRLARRGLIERTTGSGDRRTRPLTLTEAGRSEVREIHAAADHQVRQALGFVRDEDHATLLAGLERYAKALRYARLSAPLKIRPIRPEDDPAIARIIVDVMTEFGAVGCGYSIEDAEVSSMHSSYHQPGAAYFVVTRDDEILGGGGVGPLPDSPPGTCELKKMYFRPELRGTGMGVRLLRHCLHTARLLGYRQVYLETLEAMHAARTLYRKFGFEDLDAPRGNTGHFKCNRWMIKDL